MRFSWLCTEMSYRGILLLLYFEHMLLPLLLPESICTSTSVKTVCAFATSGQQTIVAADVFLQLHLDTKGWSHRLKHRWVHGDAVLRCEPEETWNCVLWILLPRQQHLLWVLCKFCFLKVAVDVAKGGGFLGGYSVISGLFVHLP